MKTSGISRSSSRAMGGENRRKGLGGQGANKGYLKRPEHEIHGEYRRNKNAAAYLDKCILTGQPHK